MLHYTEHKIVGIATESASTCGRRFGGGDHRALHEDGNRIEHVDCTRSSTYSKVLPGFRVTGRRA